MAIIVVGCILPRLSKGEKVGFCHLNMSHVQFFFFLNTPLRFSNLPPFGTPAAVMDTITIGGRQWYAKVLILSDHNVVPGQTSGGIKATKMDCVEAYGSPSPTSRYSYIHRGCMEYRKYVQELYERCYHEESKDLRTIP